MSLAQWTHGVMPTLYDFVCPEKRHRVIAGGTTEGPPHQHVIIRLNNITLTQRVTCMILQHKTTFSHELETNEKLTTVLILLQYDDRFICFVRAFTHLIKISRYSLNADNGER